MFLFFFFLFSYCSAADSETRAAAASLWLLTASQNLAATQKRRSAGNLNRVKLHSTIAMSLLAGSEFAIDRGALKSALEAVVEQAAVDGKGFQFSAQQSMLHLKVDETTSMAGSAAATDDDVPFGEQLKALTQVRKKSRSWCDYICVCV